MLSRDQHTNLFYLAISDEEENTFIFNWQKGHRWKEKFDVNIDMRYQTLKTFFFITNVAVR